MNSSVNKVPLWQRLEMLIPRPPNPPPSRSRNKQVVPRANFIYKNTTNQKLYKFDPNYGWFVKNHLNNVPKKILFAKVPNKLMNVMYTQQRHKTNIDPYDIFDTTNPKIHYKQYMAPNGTIKWLRKTNNGSKTRHSHINTNQVPLYLLHETHIVTRPNDVHSLLSRLRGKREQGLFAALHQRGQHAISRPHHKAHQAHQRDDVLW